MWDAEGAVPSGMESSGPDTMTLLKAVADPVRWQALQFLLAPERSECSRDRGVCGCDFERVLQLTQPTISHHMKVLVDAGWVRAERQGRWVFYEIVPEAFAALQRRLDPFSGPVPERPS